LSGPLLEIGAKWNQPVVTKKVFADCACAAPDMHANAVTPVTTRFIVIESSSEKAR
jgi:hypothetical protein